MADVFPRPDDDFNAVANTFSAWLATNFASIGVSAGENTAIQTAFADWNTKFPNHNEAQADAAMKAQQKDDSRAALEALMRAAARKVTAAADRIAAGLNEYADRRGRVPAPTSRPILMVDTSQRFQHLISFKDEATPNSKGKPDGVAHIEIWCAIGPTPPVSPTGCVFLATDTNTPYLNNIDPSHAGEMVHYIGRWVNSRGEKGPWSETASATVTG